MASGKVEIECHIGPKLRLLASVIDNVAEIVEDQPWNDQAKDALQELRELLETVEPRQTR